jgi:hypothetical protein
MTNPNPYSPPRAAMAPDSSSALAEGGCPQCGSLAVTRPTFTWWGGALGPKLLHHAVCGQCGFGFNAKTGKSNSTAIGVYVGISSVLGLVIAVLYIMSK